ncbi:dihydrodipicolinate synthase family protein [Phytoactinopolyspora alkaliphila]|uniref:Dihydrodipicolinate synthase family protein n=1 Tax=Phytoactinopolyspora alkaliphila TaxID=1783498 RepID=A0A6N9YP74_9ACTN|nr:dihydrodipicolinate synthase family protein [Phytoactinopolyspora alkaliphila]NED96747.1 dihydrodipicolinate synthase family protein [Phytoactinopolyspora alkaliphila]
MTTIQLPADGGGTATYTLHEPGVWTKPAAPFESRVAFAAAHVVADPLGDNTPGAPAVVDWDSTLAFRHHLWSYGLGVAEAMDTAQRGMGLDWPATHELIRRSAAEAASVGGRIAAGAGTDHLTGATSLDDVVSAYEMQLAAVQDAGAQAIIMASRQLAALATGPDDYRAVYDRVLPQAGSPVILHWLGPMFDPALSGYWGTDDVDVAIEHVLRLIRDHADQIDGVKVSLLDDAYEKTVRAHLPSGVRLYTGDDFNYPELIRGDGAHHSDALLGIFAAIAPAASAALQALDAKDDDAYDAAFTPTLALARHVFSAPTYYYKAGIAFLSWLSGFQPGFTMVGGLQSARSLPHLVEAFRLADSARLLPDPELAASRMTMLLKTYGVL